MAHKNRGRGVVVGRAMGILVLLVGILLAARLCGTSPLRDDPIPSIFDPHSANAESLYRLSNFVLVITAVIFVLVFTLLAYVVVKFRARAADAGREPVFFGSVRKTAGRSARRCFCACRWTAPKILTWMRAQKQSANQVNKEVARRHVFEGTA